MKKKINFKKKHNIIFFIIAIILVCIFSYAINNNMTNNKETELTITEILNSKYYSYLPEQAKEFIEKTYNETGTILLTEKNKESHQPYLNPEYIEYLTMSSSEQNKLSVIPTETIVDYSYIISQNLLTTETLPASFDLRNVDGKNYMSRIENQGGLGLCWAFGTLGHAASHVMYTTKEPYTEESINFSERQLDYALASDGIIDSLPLYNMTRTIGRGGGFVYASSILVDGLTLVDDSWTTSDGTYEYTEKMEMNKVYSFNKSYYELNTTIDYPQLIVGNLDLTNEDNVTLRENFIKNLKSIIMTYGGAYIGTIDPQKKCTTQIDDKQLMYDDGSCLAGGHAMQLIGWDDNFEYSICTNTKDQNNEYYIHNDTSNCTGGTIVNGKGAWIIKNSWGESSKFSIVYLAYDSKRVMDIRVITNLQQKNWDNYYSTGEKINESHESSDSLRSYERQSSENEKLVKIKFAVGSQEASYNIYIAPDGETFTKYGSIQSEFPGIYTFDTESFNITLNKDKFAIRVESSNGKLSSQINAYTVNLGTTPQIYTEDAIFKNDINSSSTNNYYLRINSKTVNIPEDIEITYKVLDSSNKEITVPYEVTENIVFANRVFAKLVIDNSLPKGDYKIQSIYNNEVLDESTLDLTRDIAIIDGEGTESDPYIITKADQLDILNHNLSGYYELGNDIDLTYETSNPKGIFYNEGKGWKPIIEFKGGFDGKNYSIKGLTINRPTETDVGLFSSLSTVEEYNIFVKNLSLVNPNIIGKEYVGGFVGRFDTSNKNGFILKNLSTINGSISGTNYTAGIIGRYSGGNSFDNQIIDSLYNSASISTTNSGSSGIIGMVWNFSSETNNVIKITNIINKGTITSVNNYPSGLLGWINSTKVDTTTIIVENGINTGKLNKTTGMKNEVSYSLNETKKVNIHLKNIYYLEEDTAEIIDSRIAIDNVTHKSISELTSSSSYTSWSNFSTYWNHQTIDNIPRIPVLKNTAFEYTSISNLTLTDQQTINLYDHLEPTIDIAKNIEYSIGNTSIATIDSNGNISPKSVGTTTLNVVSSYDGYQKAIPITINAHPKIIYHTNFDTDKTETILFEGTPITIKTISTTRTGYTFGGWNTKSDGTGNNYNVNEQVSPDDVIHLYAKWTPIKYTVAFNNNGGTGTMSNQEFNYDEEKELSENSFTRTGYTFSGWNTKQDGTGTSYENKKTVKNLASTSTTITLYAKWTPIKYTIKFNNNGGTGTMSNQEHTYDVEQALSKNTFTKEGYKFNGWNTKQDGTGTSYANQKSIKNLATTETTIILYAQWAEIQYVITFDPNGGTGTMSDQELSYDVSEKLNKNKFTKTGYSFNSWNTKSDGTGTSYLDEESVENLVSTDKTITLYAKWTPIKYTVEFNNNGGTGTMFNQEFTYDSEKELLENEFTRKGYTFSGWNTKQDGTGTLYENKTTVKNLSTTETTITLYAKWTPIKYTVEFNNNGGTGTMPNQEFTYDVEKELSENTFKKEGYKFNGWNTKSDGTGISYTNKKSVKNIASTMTTIILYAQWEIISQFDSEDYTIDDTKKIISNIPENTTLEECINNLVYAPEYKIKVYNKNNTEMQPGELITTGSKVVVLHDETVIKEFTSIVMGDVNGDGKVTATDVSKTYSHIVKNITITEEHYLIAGDVNRNNEINSTDISKIFSYIVGKISTLD